jgi:ribosomal protein S18 acetylase RimI-like enzyme
MVDSESHSRSKRHEIRDASVAYHGRRLLRINPWPGDPSTVQLQLLDHRVLPDETVMSDVIASIRSRGAARIRTGVLFPVAAQMCERLGFATVDTLALLELPRAQLRELALTPVPTTHRVTPIGPLGWGQAINVDQAAFGPIWGYNKKAIRSMRSATPMFRARSVRRDRRTIGYLMAGIADRTGYIQRLAVLASERRQGIARHLVHDAVLWMGEHSVNSVLVNTGIDNEPALDLYRSLGFEMRSEVLTVGELTL